MVGNVYQLRGGLDNFRVILVTGPQRSGTTFVAKAFSHDMHRPFVDEAVFGVGNVDLWRRMVEGAQHCIIQCPAMMRFVHDVPDDALVVVMQRNVADIVASQERIGWTDNEIELKNYGRTSGISSEVKYSWWNTHKWQGPSNWLEIDYESMKDHPLWVDKEDRRQFGTKQTEVLRRDEN